MSALLTRPLKLVRDRFWRASWAGSYEVHYAAGVSVWARWFVAALLLYVLFQPPPSSWPSSPPSPAGRL